MLITVLRDTGMSVKLVRRALDDPGAVAGLLHEHVAEVQRKRQEQDEAISDAREFFTTSPQIRRHQVPEMTVVSKVVPGSSSSSAEYSWESADAATAATIAELVRMVESCGAEVAGSPWRSWAMETPDQRRTTLTSTESSTWLAKVPVSEPFEIPADLAGDIEMQTFEAREELSVFIPGKSSMAKFGTAFSRLITHQPADACIDVTRLRQVLRADGVETSAALYAFDDTDATSLARWFTP